VRLPGSGAEHVAPRILSERAHVDEPGAVGIRPEPAATLRRYGGQTRRVPRRGRMSRSPSLLDWRLFFVAGRQQFRNLPRGQRRFVANGSPPKRTFAECLLAECLLEVRMHTV
jgi:hypothetical protein